MTLDSKVLEEKQFNSNLQKPGKPPETWQRKTIQLKPPETWQWAGTHCSQMSPHGDLFWDLGPLWVPLFTILGPFGFPFTILGPL